MDNIDRQLIERMKHATPTDLKVIEAYAQLKRNEHMAGVNDYIAILKAVDDRKKIAIHKGGE